MKSKFIKLIFKFFVEVKFQILKKRIIFYNLVDLFIKKVLILIRQPDVKGVVIAIIWIVCCIGLVYYGHRPLI